jgi:ERCC4-type nuclease
VAKCSETQIKAILDTMIILIDTREKSEHIIENFNKYDIKWIKHKLDFGDYSVMIPKNEKLDINEDIYFKSQVAIERKNSLNELGANISTNRERFKKEFLRGKDSDLILMIEENTYSDIIKNNYDNNITPNSYLAMLHSLSAEFKLPFIFISKDVSFVFIYKTLYYYIRNYLKSTDKH